VDAAAEAGFGFVSLWVQAPSIYPNLLLTPEMARDVARRLDSSGVRPHTLEVFDLTSPEVIASYRPALESGASLGGRSATVIHMRNQDRSEVLDLFNVFAELAAQYGLGVNIEPIA